MSLPIFFSPRTAALHETIELDEDTAKHVVQVLRMKEGEALQVTDGKGNLLTAIVSETHKKKCTVKITAVKSIPPAKRGSAIAISLLKNASRFEWFLEKATELGIQHIIPLICERTERQHFRLQRMQSVLVSAMLQSQQAWLPQLHEPIHFDELFETFENTLADRLPQRFIAHCMEAMGKQNLKTVFKPLQGGIVLIGPEGDFTVEEVGKALHHQFLPVSLGETRLRTETAAIAAAVILSL